MASDRAITTGTAASTAVNSPELGPRARDAARTAGERLLKRAALYARVSPEKQEREETIASQVDLLYQIAAAQGYDVAPGSVFIDDGVSGTRLDRPALDR
jgi:predicted site-specific integrase-resolvase